VDVKTKAALASTSTPRTAAVRFPEGMSDSLLSGWQIQAHRLNQNPRAHNGIFTTLENDQSRPASTAGAESRARRPSPPPKTG
jgi:hypothetical protein